MAGEDNVTKQVMEAFDAFKTANDANMQKRDVLLEEQTERINKVLNSFETQNQNLVIAQNNAEKMQKQLDSLEAAINRANLGTGGESVAAKEAAEFRNAFEHCLRRTPDARDQNVIGKFKNTLVKSDDTGAGYLQAPAEIVREIIKDILEISPMRSLVTVRNIGGPSLKQPKRTATAGAARRVGETEQRVNTGDPAYGMVEFNAPEMFARAEISQQMLEDADYDLVGELRSEFVDQFALKENREILSGTGASNQAQGLLVAEGIGEVVSGDANKLTADGLINLFYGIKTHYARNAQFIMNRLTIAEIRKLKDTTNQYLWQPGIAGSVPNTILGNTYVEVPDMPNVAANAYPIMFGDFRRAYVVVDRIGFGFQPDFTTGADNGIVVYRARKRMGGGVRQTEPVLKFKVST